MYRKAMAAPPGEYQLLCANCNWIKRVENKEESSSSGDEPLDIDEPLISY